MSGYDFVYTESLEMLLEDHDGWCSVRWWSDTRTWTPPPICPRHFGTSAEVSVGHFGPFTKCWDSSVLVPKCSGDTSAPTQKSKTFRYQRCSAKLS